jgi:hypothetical protein
MATSHGLTLLDVIQAVSEVAEHDLEIIATVVHLIGSGQVRLHKDAIGALRQLVATVDAAAHGPAVEQTRPWHDATQDATIVSCITSQWGCLVHSNGRHRGAPGEPESSVANSSSRLSG